LVQPISATIAQPFLEVSLTIMRRLSFQVSQYPNLLFFTLSITQRAQEQ
jgi:hypothetical protein